MHSEPAPKTIIITLRMYNYSLKFLFVQAKFFTCLILTSTNSLENCTVKLNFRV